MNKLHKIKTIYVKAIQRNYSHIYWWSHSAAVNTPDFESGILGSNPGETFGPFWNRFDGIR